MSQLSSVDGLLPLILKILVFALLFIEPVILKVSRWIFDENVNGVVQKKFLPMTGGSFSLTTEGTVEKRSSNTTLNLMVMLPVLQLSTIGTSLAC
jgi:hypothetical protein